MEPTYNPTLIGLSILIAIFASYVALNLAHSVTEARGRAQVIWLACGAMAMGVGIWSMHFVGMLAFRMPGMEMGYDVPLLIVSVAISVGASTIALFIVSRPKVSLPALVIGGVAMAAAIAGMHYTGMYSMRMAATIQWNASLVFLSIVIALVASFAALFILLRLRHKSDQLLLLNLAAIAMGIAISGMHYTGMAAATFIHKEGYVFHDANILVSSGLAIAVIVTSFLILTLALVGSVGQRNWMNFKRQSQEVLEKSDEKFRTFVGAVKDYAIFMLDPDGIITTWNSGAERITGYRATEAIGRHISVFYLATDEEANSAEEDLRTAARAGYFETEARRVRKDGSTFWSNIVISPLHDKAGRLTGFSMITRDITELREADSRLKKLNEELEQRVEDRTQELQRRENQLRAITNAMPVFVGQVDREERFLFVNDALASWFGRTVDQALGLTFREMLGEDRYLQNEPYLKRALGGQVTSYERQSQSGDRNAVLSITYVPEIDSQGKIAGVTLVATDVTKYIEIETELKDAKDAAEKANVSKTQFLANMSHEIRTPIGAVTGFVSLLKNPELSETEKLSFISVIERNSQHLLRLIDDILDLSKVEAGKIALDPVEIPLPEFLKEFYAVNKLKCDDKKIEFRFRLESKIPDWICTDPVRLSQVLSNIVGNAIKFTDRGFVELLVSYNSSRLEFTVSDTGIGLTAEQAGKLFQPFVQADPSTTRKFGGTGLGLILAKRLSVALGGDLSLKESSPGLGSRFAITIQPTPVETAKLIDLEDLQTGPSVRKSPDVSGRLNRLKILLVEDSPDNQMLIATYLEKTGAKLILANDGRQGVDRALAEPVDVVLMDTQMPTMDGNEATQELRKAGFTKPIVALTAHAMREEKVKAFASGCTDYLTKPIDRAKLVHVLEYYLPVI